MIDSKNVIEEKFEGLRKEFPNLVVKPDIIKKLINFKMSNKNKNMNEYITELYEEYIYELDSLDEETLKKYLRVLKNADVRDNQILENVDSFLISLYLESEKIHAIDNALKKDKITEKDISSLHAKLLKGTTNDTNTSYRNHNRSYVGYYDTEKCDQVINFFPLDYREIDSAMKEFTDYFNEEENDKTKLFIKPFTVHGIISSLQVFEDGNTRLGRLLQNVKLYRQTNDMLGKNYNKPIIYITKQYFPQRVTYRSLIEEMAKNPDDDNINRWTGFNIDQAMSAITMANDNVQKIKYLK